MTYFRQPAPIIAALALACGALETPDLQHGVVTGQIQLSGTPPQQPYVYVLGSPDSYAEVKPDGTFRLDEVPIGQPQIVLYDGDLGAESVQVQVQGETESQMAPLGRPLKRAGAILAAANPASGVSTAKLTFTVQGTRLQGVPGPSGARLWPLPAGSFTLHADLPGYREASAAVDVTEGLDQPKVISLDIDSDTEHPGCNGCGGCENGLKCASDGECVECIIEADCNSGGVCDSDHRCRYSSSGGMTWCQPCSLATVTSDCGAGTGLTCLTVNANGGSVSGYCSYTCGSDSDCPAGYRCNSVSGGHACEPLVSCVALTAAFGSSCSTDSPCQSALEQGECVSGHCTARCQLSCPTGYSCDSVTQHCVKTNP